ncbi:MAG: hypothetical protein JWO22_888 [Frankiales bacterium]|nr:hypothetical protein [Frankiales bacterium]
MRSNAPRGALLVLSACTLIGAAGVAGAASPSAVPAPSTVRIAGNVLPNLSKLSSRAADPSTMMSVGVSLAHPHAAAEQALATALSTPGSADYGRFLTYDQVVSRFGVPTARTSHVVAALRKAGLTVTAPDAMGDYVAATGTVAQVQKAFGVTERLFVARNGTRFLANTTGPVVNVADQVTTVVGLNTLQHYTLPKRTANKTAQDACFGGACIGNTSPQDLWSVYEQPSARAGQGVTMAVIGEGDPKNLQGYLTKQEDHFKLPHTKLTVKCVQGSCGKETDGDGEWQIDTQASAGMAPKSSGETLYFAKSILDGDLNNSFVAWAHDAKGPKLASASLGECESSPLNSVFTGPLGSVNGNTASGTTAIVAFGNGEQSAIDPVLRSAVLQGKTLFASTGDTGSSCPLFYLPLVGAGNGVLNQGLPEQNYPAVSVSAVAVGGTVTYTNEGGDGQPGTRFAEYSWPFGGGGASLWTPAPTWQNGVSGINQPCLTAPTTICRAVPDIASQSGDVVSNGYAVYGAGGATSGGGTSLSSPLWMGMWARVQGAAGKNLGFAAPLLYKAASTPTGYAASFHDITTGSNGIHVATPGWDYTTGLGTPRVGGLIKTLLHHS